ncbi:MAG: xanthine dehydrogenase family protein molybdopterin-binding subunit [Pseudomonadota bacterium]|nr:xanthine dehydrogenase family protein molybdopterin-binding subunit [Pseudomonadota bacterium]
MSVIGQAIDRTDGPLKVTGAARYAAEHALPRLAHAVLVQSTIAHGTISNIDSAGAMSMPGVILVMTHLNARRLPAGGKAAAHKPPAGRVLNLLQDAKVLYQNQPIAVVVADTLEHATEAAHRLQVRYEVLPAERDFELASKNPAKPEKVQGHETDSHRGDLQIGMQAGTIRHEALYTTPIEHHHPMEPHATVASWDGDQLTLYDATQYVSGVRKTIATTLGIAPEKIRVICPFVGGGFGCKGSTWSHVALAAMAAQQVGRPVKLVLDRTQMVGPVGARPRTAQHVTLAATSDGKLQAMQHAVVSSTSLQEDWTESSAMVSRMLYDVPHQRTSHRLARMHIGTPTFMRAPGEASGSFALESAMDELALALQIDPIQLRLNNYAEQDPEEGKPWSSKSLRECYRVGAERFGWSRRTPAPRSMQRDGQLIGMGMATATYPANRSAASASATLQPDGSVRIQCGTQDLGTGTYTVIAQVAADALDLPLARIHVELGDTNLPDAPVSGGSQTVASVGPAVQMAAAALRQQLIDLVVNDAGSPLHGLAPERVALQQGWLQQHDQPSVREPLATVLARHSSPIVARAEAKPGDEKSQFSMHSFGAVFVEVEVDPDLGTIRVSRVVASYGIGRLMNAKTGNNQLVGGIVWGIGQALLERTELDPLTARPVNANLGEYHVPVNADIGSIDVIVVDENDPHINALGAKGIGEIGITGVAAAIANAVYHATGKRIRDLPITLDKLIG